MVKGQTIQQRDLIHKPDVNYRKLDALNCSMIKLFDRDPVKFYEQFKLGKSRKENTSVNIIIGDLVDFYLLDCRGNEDEFNNRFDEKFALFEGSKGSSQVFLLADVLFEISKESLNENGEVTASFEDRFTEALNRLQADGKFKGKSYDKALEIFYETGYSYFQSLMENIGKTVIDVSLLEKAKTVALGLLNDIFTKDVFCDCDDSIEYFPKFPIEWIYSVNGKDIKCKSELDVIHVDHHSKKIYPMDLKTTYDNEAFERGYLKYQYYLQAAFYELAVKYWAKEEGMESYTVEPMEFIVGDTSSNNRRPIRYKLAKQDMEAGLKGFTLGGVYYKGIEELVEDISWAEESNVWNVSKHVLDKNGRLELKLNYDVKD